MAAFVITYPGEDGGRDALLFSSAAAARREHAYLTGSCFIQADFAAYATREAALAAIRALPDLASFGDFGA